VLQIPAVVTIVYGAYSLDLLAYVASKFWLVLDICMKTNLFLHNVATVGLFTEENVCLTA
jgi:hypothetical protein